MRKRLIRAALVFAVAAALCAGAWSLPPVRTILLDSFTRRQTAFIELYFTENPRFDGASVLVPFAVNDHGSGARSLVATLTVEAADGKVLATETYPVEPHQGAAVPVTARIRAKGNDVALVRVSLTGHPQTLHFRFGKPPEL
ncbi:MULTISPECIES: hypothetical protein [Streptomyces]|uniref:hypothetical protein n=1 Tax=Streptomyces TaxID=1883 RepID=UPI0004BEC4DD|nr:MULTISPECIES: hypothetical protein [Streptomyces]